MHFCKVNDPAASDAIQIGHIDVHRIHAMRRKNSSGCAPGAASRNWEGRYVRRIIVSVRIGALVNVK